MARQLKHPQSETELNQLLDDLYRITKDEMDSNDGKITGYKNLLEVIRSEANIVTAIHKIKANQGSKTAGVDDLTIRDFLDAHYNEVIEYVQNSLKNYHPKPVRRKWIPKPGKKEKRPLGIPTIGDRIIQEYVRKVIEPILEAQFFNHSYGFRPMRDTHQALVRVTRTMWNTGYTWVVEGDISKFFDNANHTILLKKMWNMGIRDHRVLMVIKQMLKVGIFGEIKTNEVGTAQGGIISPILANVYLHSMDKWITREWEEKKTRNSFTRNDNRIGTLKKTNLKPAYFVRYADDWVLITDSKENAEKWKHRIQKYLKNNLKLELSMDKTLITNVTKKSVKFLGFEIKMRQGKSRKGWITQTRPNRERLKSKISEIHMDIRNLRKQPNKEQLIEKIAHINSKIRGLAEYYSPATLVNVDLAKYAWKLNKIAKRSLRNQKVNSIPAKETNNLLSVHVKYNTRIWAIEYEGIKFGLTSIAFATWKKTKLKTQSETPYTKEGRKLYQERSKKTPPNARMDRTLTPHRVKYALIAKHGGSRYLKLYNFEYLMNRAYTYNKDKGKCRICNQEPDIAQINIHHCSPELPQLYVNKVEYLATVCIPCHQKIHDQQDYSTLSKKEWKAIQKFRNLLPATTIKEVQQARKKSKETA